MKNQSKRIVASVSCALALFALPAAFANHDDDQEFKMTDTNGDGQISKAEHAAKAKKMFAEADTNHDGSIDAAELSACMVKHGEKADKASAGDWIKMFDQNADGKLSATEHDAGAERMFAQADKNGDGMLSKDECEAAKKEMHQKDKMGK